MVLFAISYKRSCKKGNVRVRHAPLGNIPVSPYLQADRIDPQFFLFLSKLSQVLGSDGGRVIPSTRAYFLRRRESYPLPHGHISSCPKGCNRLGVFIPADLAKKGNVKFKMVNEL
jgi:hypothetical protein